MAEHCIFQRGRNQIVGKYNKVNSLLHEESLPRKEKTHDPATLSINRTLGVSDNTLVSCVARRALN